MAGNESFTPGAENANFSSADHKDLAPVGLPDLPFYLPGDPASDPVVDTSEKAQATVREFRRRLDTVAEAMQKLPARNGVPSRRKTDSPDFHPGTRIAKDSNLLRISYEVPDEKGTGRLEFTPHSQLPLTEIRNLPEDFPVGDPYELEIEVHTDQHTLEQVTSANFTPETRYYIGEEGIGKFVKVPYADPRPAISSPGFVPWHWPPTAYDSLGWKKTVGEMTPRDYIIINRGIRQLESASKLFPAQKKQI